MEKEIYRVEYTRVLYVLANGEVDAEAIAEAAETNPAEITSINVTKANKSRAEKDGWSGCIPYPHNKKSIGELL